jgi:hemolysin activation/secretion protein
VARALRESSGTIGVAPSRLAIAFGLALAAGSVSGAKAEPAQPRACDSRVEPCFVLMALTIDGVTAYPLKSLAPLYADDLTREVSITDLARIAQAVTDRYRADGYFLARAVVPEQTGPEGMARIVVYEGHVSDLQVTGPAGPAVAALLTGITEARPVRLADLDRRLTLATDRPGLKLKTHLEPVLDDPAQHRLVVQADRQAVTGSLYADNRGTESAGPWQTYGRLAANSALLAGDQLAASVLTVPEDPKEFSQGELSYLYPLGTGGTLGLRASAAHARDASANLGAVVGNQNRAASLRLSHPFSRGRKHAVWGALAFDASQVKQDWGAVGGYEDNLRVLRASVFATRQAEGRTTTGFVQLSRGLDVLGATDAPGRSRSRWDADGQFWKLNVHSSHYRDLGRRAGIHVQADAQWSPDPLLASEEFAAGALPYGRAYNYAEIAGEKGAGALAELRYGFDPAGPALSFFQLYAFADAAKVWRKDASPGFESAALASAGVGTRLTFGRRATVRVEAARPLTRIPYVTRDKDWRASVSLTAGF